MPGIAGIISRRLSAECEQIARSMTGAMLHESFYVSGLHSVAELGVYGGWVALEGSMAAHQPFINERRDIVLLLSGECFIDFSDITALSSQRHGIGSNPGDWLVHLYEEQEEKFFKNLNGLFSGLLIDR